MPLCAHQLTRAAAPILVIGGSLLSATAAADTVTLTPSRDNTLFESSSGSPLSNSVGDYLFTGKTATQERRRALVHFSLASIPPGSTITSVELTMLFDRGVGTGMPVNLHRLTSDWGQGNSNAGEPGGRGTPATPNDPTWSLSHFPTTSWGRAGGDFIEEPSGGVMVADTTDLLYTWTSTDAMVADVQAWLNTPAENFGWIVIGNEDVAGSALRMHSLEGPTPPSLVLTFTPPGPNCGTADFDGDGDSGTDFDIEAFFACLAGNCCPACFAGGADFNMDGDSGTDADIEAFFRVLAGGDC